MRTYVFRFLIIISLVFFCNDVFANAGYQWKQIKKKNHIIVFSKKVKNSKFKMYKASIIIDKPIEVIYAVLTDVPTYSDWMPDVEKASVIKQLDKGSLYGNMVVHVLFDAMWPVKNRDVVVKSVPTITNWDKGNVIINLQDTCEYDVPLEKGRMRVKKFYAQFNLQNLGRTRTSITYITHAEPGGSIPAGIAQIQTARIPYKTLRNLAKVSEKQIYIQRAKNKFL